MKNISEACRRLGVSRKHYYDIKYTLAEESVEGLMEKTRQVARVRNRVAPEIEEAILEYCLHEPTHGQKRVANELNRKHNWKISDGGVRSVWLRHGEWRIFLQERNPPCFWILKVERHRYELLRG